MFCIQTTVGSLSLGDTGSNVNTNVWCLCGEVCKPLDHSCMDFHYPASPMTGIWLEMEPAEVDSPCVPFWLLLPSVWLPEPQVRLPCCSGGHSVYLPSQLPLFNFPPKYLFSLLLGIASFLGFSHLCISAQVCSLCSV